MGPLFPLESPQWALAHHPTEPAALAGCSAAAQPLTLCFSFQQCPPHSFTPCWRRTFWSFSYFSVSFAGYPASRHLPPMRVFQDLVHGPLFFFMGMTSVTSTRCILLNTAHTPRTSRCLCSPHSPKARVTFHSDAQEPLSPNTPHRASASLTRPTAHIHLPVASPISGHLPSTWSPLTFPFFHLMHQEIDLTLPSKYIQYLTSWSPRGVPWPEPPAHHAGLVIGLLWPFFTPSHSSLPSAQCTGHSSAHSAPVLSIPPCHQSPYNSCPSLAWSGPWKVSDLLCLPGVCQTSPGFL